nr:GGDEF domain-containing protein [uncultured Sulfurimonas sp.]
MPQKLAPNLLSIIDSIENNRLQIVSEWIELDTVKLVFQRYKIDSIKFKKNYGISILEYFIDVVREEKKVGDCPTMSRVINFLLDKHITPKDVFDICMGLRKSLVNYLFNKKLIEHNSMKIMDEVSNIYDANLSGVLGLFTSHYENKQQTIQKIVARQKKFSQITKILNFVNTKIIIVQNEHIIFANKPFLEVVGIDNIKEFAINYSNTFSFMKNVESSCSVKFDLENIDEWLHAVYNSHKPFTTEIFNKKRLESFTYSAHVTTLPQSEPIKYIISFNGVSAYVADEAIIKDKLEHDKLTKLYNYAKFIHVMSEEQRKALANNIQLAMVVVDIPELKEINKKLGMDVGDKTIIEVAKKLKSQAQDGMIIARLEGSRFGVLMQYEHEQEAYDWCSELYEDLNKTSQRKTVSITAFDLAETLNSVQIRAHVLIDDINLLQEGTVATDFENIILYEPIENQKKFTDRLKNIKSIKSTIYYKGLSVVADNKIIHTDKDSIIIKLPKKEFYVIQYNKCIYLEFPILGWVKASIYSVDEKNNSVTINRFRIYKDTPLKRKLFRVEAEEDMSVHLSCDNTENDGIVYDMNEECIAIIIKRKKNLDEGSFVFINTTLNINNIMTSFISETTVKKIEKLKSGFKIILLCHLDNSNKNLIKEYIAKRQIAIINELKDKL